MENRDRTRDQGGQGNKPGQGGGQQQGGREGQGGNGRPGQGGGQPGSREGQGERQDLAKSSKFVRNEGLATEGQDVRQEQGGSRGPRRISSTRADDRARAAYPTLTIRTIRTRPAVSAAPQNKNLGQRTRTTSRA